ncbi:acyl-CoA dehydrogenase family protein [Sutcliffiella sp. NPDC057660]|uniref:acyl-CoA dehydrogenase family protein n=1 Tax=Sutcliffiella sp. NPDC057660 TaxID=3346199 RepID=UPI0036BB329D
MNYQPYLTEEHEQFRQKVRNFIQTEVAPNISDWEEAGEFPLDVLKRMGDLGLLGLRYPKEIGGESADYFKVMVFAEELNKCGAGGFPMAVAVQTDMATPPIYKFGTAYHHETFLTPAIRGEKLASLGISEPNHGSDVSSIQTRAVRDGDEWVINGSKMYITNGPRADFVTLVTRTSDEPGYKGISLFLVETDREGFSISRKLDKLGMRSSDTAELMLEDVRVPHKNLLGTEGRGFYQIMWQLQSERMIAAASAIGLMDYCFSIAQLYIEENQLEEDEQVMNVLTDIVCEIEVCREMTYSVAYRYANGEVPSKEISMVKLTTAQAAHKVADIVLDLIGEEACDIDHPIQRIWRDSRLNRIGAGTDEVMKEIISKEIGL